MHFAIWRSGGAAAASGMCGSAAVLSALAGCVEVMVESLASACRLAAAVPVGVTILLGGAIVFMCIINFRIELFRLGRATTSSLRRFFLWGVALKTSDPSLFFPWAGHARHHGWQVPNR